MTQLQTISKSMFVLFLSTLKKLHISAKAYENNILHTFRNALNIPRLTIHVTRNAIRM